MQRALRPCPLLFATSVEVLRRVSIGGSAAQRVISIRRPVQCMYGGPEKECHHFDLGAAVQLRVYAAPEILDALSAEAQLIRDLFGTRPGRSDDKYLSFPAAERMFPCDGPRQSSRMMKAYLEEKYRIGAARALFGAAFLPPGGVDGGDQPHDGLGACKLCAAARALE